MAQTVTQQKESLTLKNGTKLETIFSINLNNVKIFDKLQEKGNVTDQEKLVRVWKGPNPLSVGVYSVDFVAYGGRRFFLFGYGEPEDASRVVFSQKAGILTAYKVLDEKGANYARSLKINEELGAELPTHQTLISALDQNESEKKKLVANGGVWGYVAGKGIDLEGLYTFSGTETGPKVVSSEQFKNLLRNPKYELVNAVRNTETGEVLIRAEK